MYVNGTEAESLLPYAPSNEWANTGSCWSHSLLSRAYADVRPPSSPTFRSYNKCMPICSLTSFELSLGRKKPRHHYLRPQRCRQPWA